jgi:hypothetical protein
MHPPLANSSRLAEYVYNQQEGVKENRNQSEESLRLMQDLAARYGSFDAAEKRIFTEGEGEGDIVSTESDTWFGL